MDYPIWPRVKEFCCISGSVALPQFLVFAVGGGNRFFSVLDEFFPGEWKKANYDEANIRISISDT